MSGSQAATIHSADRAAASRQPVSLRRHALVLGLVGGCACVLAVAYALRALTDGGGLGAWAVTAALTLIGVAHLAMFVDAREPLLVADDTGLRIRLGRQWRGLRWEEIAEVEVRARRRGLRDGRVVISPGVVGPDLAGLGVRGRWAAASNARVYGAPLGVAYGAATKASTADLAAALHDLAAGRAPVRSTAWSPPEPLTVGAPEAVIADEDAVPEAGAGRTTRVIGGVLVDARQRLGVSVEELAARTRIRPHVIEGIEAEDFGPCGGDFYARGHLRVLAGALGLDPGPLLDCYDRSYASAPIDPRSVFEAELSTARRPRGGAAGAPNWTALIAVVLALMLLWGIARLVTDHRPAGGDTQRSGQVAPSPVTGIDPEGHQSVRISVDAGDSR